MSFAANRRKIATRVIAVAMTLLIGPVQSFASELINIQFQTPKQEAFKGDAAIPELGGTWNQLIDGSGNSRLVNSSGEKTNTSISWTGKDVLSGENGFSKTSESALMTSYLYGTGSNTITFFNLQENSTYNLYIYTQGGSNSKGSALSIEGKQINGETLTTKPADPSVDKFIAGQNYLAVTGQTDAKGTLSFNYSGTGENGVLLNGMSEADINGIQLMMETSGSVPEPSTYVLMGIGGLLVAFKLRSRSLSLIRVKTEDKG